KNNLPLRVHSNPYCEEPLLYSRYQVLALIRKKLCQVQDVPYMQPHFQEFENFYLLQILSFHIWFSYFYQSPEGVHSYFFVHSFIIFILHNVAERSSAFLYFFPSAALGKDF